ncbi:MAG: hypothetical protein GWO16_08485, partial [Gammaproteobacteria bacterium]|nr:hypothetical protein [Gammaproteobacteria bacterium]NIR97981.1 hypothetical protein [Gammaproteobacteria bacterium]NIT64596.1 hypothetical protein [Gammaproteobacteria bacterium]NIV21563.1 hypothetical protein [Gammaproteobacteria bacterium]NIY33176.1 hypothetical protein [Gammaproteobacteria bacterium]
GRGTALLVSGAVMVLLTWVLPSVAPVAVGAYGVYQLYRKQPAEGLLALALAVVFWFLRVPLGWLLWLAGAGMVGFGLFYLIRGLRAPSVTE